MGQISVSDIIAALEIEKKKLIMFCEICGERLTERTPEETYRSETLFVLYLLIYGLHCFNRKKTHLS